MMTFDLGTWPLTSLTYKNPSCLWPKVLSIGLQIFKGDPNNENQRFPSNLTSDNPWPRLVRDIWLHLHLKESLLHLWPNFGCNRPTSFHLIILVKKSPAQNFVWIGLYENTCWPTKCVVCYFDKSYSDFWPAPRGGDLWPNFQLRHIKSLGVHIFINHDKKSNIGPTVCIMWGWKTWLFLLRVLKQSSISRGQNVSKI